MKQQISRLIVKTFILTIVLILSDRIVGAGLEYLFYQQTHGDDYTTIYALDKTKDDVLIFGTSRASHHYNSEIISTETGFSCFNAGRDEMEIPYTEAMLQAIVKRHKPKVVILDIIPMELSGEKQIVYERIASALMPLSNKYPSLNKGIARSGTIELWKMKASRIYAYNSKIGSSLQNSYTHMGHSSIKGYEPLYKTIDTTIYKKSIWVGMNKNLPLDKDYVEILNSIIKTAQVHNIKLIISISPFYFPNDFNNNNSYKTIYSIVQNNTGVTLLDFSNDPEFTGQALLFNDDVHLNDSGAAIFTKKVVARLRNQGIWQ